MFDKVNMTITRRGARPTTVTVPRAAPAAREEFEAAEVSRFGATFFPENDFRHHRKNYLSPPPARKPPAVDSSPTRRTFSGWRRVCARKSERERESESERESVCAKNEVETRPACFILVFVEVLQSLF